MSTPVNSPDESASDAAPAAAAPEGAGGVPPWGKPRKEKKRRSYDPAPDPNKPARDKRWFLRIIAWIVFVLGAALLVIALLPRDTPPVSVEGDIISTTQMMALASLPLLLAGGFLLWWGYGKVGERLIACKLCFHVNKARSTVCANCGESLG